jgi:hypothetical protein
VSLRLLSLFACLVLAGAVASKASASPNTAVNAFVSACLRADVSLQASRPAFKKAGVRSASLNEGMLDLKGEQVKGTVYEVQASLIRPHRPYLVGCNVVAKGRFSKSIVTSLEEQLAKRGFKKIKGRPKGRKIPKTKTALYSVYQLNGRTYDVYVGDVKAGGIGNRTFLTLGLRP